MRESADRAAQIIKFRLPVLATVFLFLFSLTVVSSADSLPHQFHNWESLPLPDVSENPEYLKLACNEREGVVISRKKIVWNTEGGCDIDNTKPSQWGDALNNIAVSLTCYMEEGRQTPLKVRSVEIWSLVKIGGKTIMSQASTHDMKTSFFQKCD